MIKILLNFLWPVSAIDDLLGSLETSDTKRVPGINQNYTSMLTRSFSVLKILTIICISVLPAETINIINLEKNVFRNAIRGIILKFAINVLKIE